MDRINDLSDEIICHILSFLPFKKAASTSALSKRWRNLFAFRPTLHFDDHELGEGQSFIEFGDRMLNVSGNIREFSIKCGMVAPQYEYYSHINRWIIEVLKRGVLILDIDVTFYKGFEIRVPLEMFTCKTMVQLRLANGFEFKIPEDVSLPSLKTLFLDSIGFSDGRYCVLEKLLSVCPTLEELNIRGGGLLKTGKFCYTVSSSTLKKLTFLFPFSERLDWDITLNTPSLTYLEYSDQVPRDYPFVNLESLVEAKLNLLPCHDTFCNPTNLIKGLLNVEILELSSVHTTAIFWKFREAIPVFSNLFRLSIVARSNVWGLLQILLENSPNLHTLVIKITGRRYFDSYEQEYGLSCPVKVLKITGYEGYTVELRRMKQFMDKLSSLELVKVRAYAISDEEKSRMTRDLLKIPRSSKCNIRIKFCEETDE